MSLQEIVKDITQKLLEISEDKDVVHIGWAPQSEIDEYEEHRIGGPSRDPWRPFDPNAVGKRGGWNSQWVHIVLSYVKEDVHQRESFAGQATSEIPDIYWMDIIWQRLDILRKIYRQVLPRPAHLDGEMEDDSQILARIKEARRLTEKRDRHASRRSSVHAHIQRHGIYESDLRLLYRNSKLGKQP